MKLAANISPKPGMPRCFGNGAVQSGGWSSTSPRPQGVSFFLAPSFYGKPNEPRFCLSSAIQQPFTQPCWLRRGPSEGLQRGHGGSASPWLCSWQVTPHSVRPLTSNVSRSDSAALGHLRVRCSDAL